MSDIHRRSVLAGAGALAALPAVAAAQAPTRPPPPPIPDPVMLFTEGRLSRNALAAKFEQPNVHLALPADYKLLGRDRAETTFEAFRGKTLIINLWAEWCAPCLLELEGFAAINKQFRTDRFQMLPILTATSLSHTEEVDRVLRKVKAESLPLWIDGSPRRNALVRTLARSPVERDGALPCTLIVDPQGKVRGRLLGTNNIQAPAGKGWGRGRGRQTNIWTTSLAMELAQALDAGAVV